MFRVKDFRESERARETETERDRDRDRESTFKQLRKYNKFMCVYVYVYINR